MQSMVTRVWTLKVLPLKGKHLDLYHVDYLANECRFGWVNASYVYGLQMCSAHMRRALGTLTPWDAFNKALNSITEKYEN